jgi:hypothetical protein
VIEKAGAGSAPFPRDTQCQKSFVAKALIIFDGVACIAVVLARASRKVGSQFAALFLQTLLLFAQPEIHVARPRVKEISGLDLDLETDLDDLGGRHAEIGGR